MWHVSEMEVPWQTSSGGDLFVDLLHIGKKTVRLAQWVWPSQTKLKSNNYKGNLMKADSIKREPHKGSCTLLNPDLK